MRAIQYSVLVFILILGICSAEESINNGACVRDALAVSMANATALAAPSAVERGGLVTCDSAEPGLDLPVKVNEDYRGGPFRCYAPTAKYPTRECTCLLADCSDDASPGLHNNCELCSFHGGMYASYEACMEVGRDPAEMPTGRVVYPEPTFDAGEPTTEDEIYFNPVEQGRSFGLIELMRSFFAHSRNGETTVGPVYQEPDTRAVDDRFVKDDPCPQTASDVVSWCSDIWVRGGDTQNRPYVPSSGRVTLPVGKKVLVDKCLSDRDTDFTQIIIPETSELIFASNYDVKLRVSSILVRGALRIGSPQCRVGSRILIEMPPRYGELPNNEYGIIADSGEVDLHGANLFGSSWTRLGATANPGDTRITVDADVSGWRPGQQILLTSSTFKDEVQNQNEIMTIRNAYGSTIELESPLAFQHYGGAEYQTEVALLTRNIMIMGTSDVEATNVGPQIKLGGSKRHRVRGVMMYRGGQRNVKGAYPFHFHMLGSSPESYFFDNVVVRSFYRCFVVHGTSNVQVMRNVAFDVAGHCYYLEDGVEEGNTFAHNIGAYVHPIGPPAGGVSQSGETFEERPEATQPADAGAAAFYVSNPNNDVIGNAASGGVSGFAYPVLHKPIGLSRTVQIVPAARPFGIFQGNTAHSSGYYSLQTGGCMYFGGSLWEEPQSGGTYKLKYNSGRSAFPNRDAGPSDTPLLSNNKVWLCNSGLLFWGERLNINKWTSHDSIRAVFLLSRSVVTEMYASASSGNAASGFPGTRSDYEVQTGIQLYDTGTQTILDQATFANFRYRPELGWYRPCAIHSMTHSDQFKPEGMVKMGQITYENTDTDAIIRVDKRETGASRFFNFVAVGGSATLQGTSQIVGSWPPYWQLSGSTCIFNEAWQAHSCSKMANEDIARLDVRIPGYTVPRDSAVPPTPDNYAGYLSQFGDYSKRMTITKNEGITGVTGNTGWYLRFNQGAPTTTEVWLSQLPIQKYIILAMPYPSGTSFNIRRIFKWYGQMDATLTPAATRAEVVNGDGLKYHFDGTYLYVKLADPQFNSGNLVHEGLVVYGTRWWDLVYSIKTTNLGSSPFVSRSDPGPPPTLSGGRVTAVGAALDGEASADIEEGDDGEENQEGVEATTGGKPPASDTALFACDDLHFQGPSGSCEQVLIDGLCGSGYMQTGRYCRASCLAC